MADLATNPARSLHGCFVGFHGREIHVSWAKMEDYTDFFTGTDDGYMRFDRRDTLPIVTAPLGTRTKTTADAKPGAQCERILRDTPKPACRDLGGTGR